MKLYHLYVSGILYAELDFDTQPISIQKLDIVRHIKEMKLNYLYYMREF